MLGRGNAVRRVSPRKTRVFVNSALAGEQRMMRSSVSGNGSAPNTVAYGGGMPLANGFDNTASRSAGRGPFVNLLAKDVGSTPSGRAWAMCALHPCGKGEVVSPLLGDLAGMPDTMTGAVVTPAYPGETYITFDTTLFPTPPDDPSGSWGIDIVIPPVPEIDYLYRIRYDATSLVSNWRVVRVANFDNPEAAVGAELDLRGTTFATVGYGRVRCIAAGHTIELDAPTVSNQGRVVATQVSGQWSDLYLASPRIVSTFGAAVVDVGPPAVTDQFVVNVDALVPSYGPKIQLLSVTTDPSELVAACPSAYQGLAKDGVYTVTKFQSPLLGYPFANTGDDGVIAVDKPLDGPGPTAVAAMPQTGFCINSAGYSVREPIVTVCDNYVTDSRLGGAGPGVYAVPMSLDSAIGTYSDALTKIHPFVSMRSDMQVGIVTFRNLALNSAVGSTANVRIKSRAYFECIPQAQNPATTPFTHSPAPYDRKALDAVIVVGKQLADGYPASYNSLSQIMSVIGDALGTAGRHVVNAVGNMDIPLLSGITKELAGMYL